VYLPNGEGSGSESESAELSVIMALHYNKIVAHDAGLSGRIIVASVLSF
jgi:hypothetical protein